MKISFHGAARGVTGSCHLVTSAGKRILIDCGLFQGGREVEEENREPFGFDASEVDYLLLTHGHLDHCGRIPLLVNDGFRGEIITTSASRELARLVMLDSASLNEAEAQRNTRRRTRKKGPFKEVLPLYSVVDAMNSLDYFGRSAEYGKTIQICDGIKATFFDAGHILGSACVLLELEEAGDSRRVLFSGDLGYSGKVILRDPAPPPSADVVVMETTYGDRAHKKLRPSVDELYEVITDTFNRGGNVVIPTFALERAQEILYYLREGVEEGKLPRFMQVFLDSPMAISATEIFRRHTECYDSEARELFRNGKDPFGFKGLHFTRETAESMALNVMEGSAVILAGSGMCTGGRVRHHLKHNLWREESSILFVGYAASGTLARRIIDGADKVRIYGEEIVVRAGVHTIGGFSAHADCDELLAWFNRTGGPKQTFLVHGEEEAMGRFSVHLKDTHVDMPKLHEEFSL